MKLYKAHKKQYRNGIKKSALDIKSFEIDLTWPQLLKWRFKTYQIATIANTITLWFGGSSVFENLLMTITLWL